MASTEPFLSASWHLVAKLRPRLQPHAQISRHRMHGRTSYIVRNRATGRTFRFSPAVYLLLGLLDGRTVEEAWTVVADRLDEAAPTQDQTIRLLAQLHDADLIHGGSIPDLEEVMQRRARLWRSRWLQSFANPLAIRIRLWDPDHFLSRTLPALRPLFGPFGFALWACAVLPALVLAGVNWNELTGNLADRLLATENLILLALIFPCIKALHELAHGYAVKTGGGEVHDLGLMLLVLLPVPYIDATAANAFRSKWRRAGVSAAGILIETFLAAIMMFVWTQVEPGILRAVAYNVILIAGVSTVLLNGNPLLRFDGYFILCDLAAAPNLASRAASYWGMLVQRHVFGRRMDPPVATRAERLLFLIFAPLSVAYRVFITVTIALLIAKRFLLIGTLVAILGVATTLVWPVGRWLLQVVAGSALAPVRRRAVGFTVAFCAIFLGFLCLVPFPLHTNAEGVIWLPEKSLVRAGGEGFVQALRVAPGLAVTSGATLVTSANPELAAEIEVDRARVASAEARLMNDENSDRVQAAITRRELDIERSTLARALERAKDLDITSALDGIFVVPRAEDLPGRYHHRGDLIGYVVAPSSAIARVVVRQEDVGLVRQRLRGAQVRVAHQSGAEWPANLVREVPEASQDFPSPALMVEGGGSHAADTRDPKHAKALNRLFQLDIEMPAEAIGMAWRSHVWVRFDHGYEPLAAQWWRRLRQLLLSRFDA
jgi:putative peptide zinc metalloprotease protein